MLTEHKPLMRALRRSHTSSSSSPSSSNSSSPSSSSWIHLRSVLLVVASSSSSSSPVYSDRGSLKSPWSRRRRKHALLPKQWKTFFTPDGKLSEGGVKYDLKSSKEERDSVKAEKRKEYENLRKECRKIIHRYEKSSKLKETTGKSSNEDSGDLSQVFDSPGLEDEASSRRSVSSEGGSPVAEDLDRPVYDQSPECSGLLEGEDERDKSVLTCEDASAGDTESTDSDSSEDLENIPLLSAEGAEARHENPKESSSLSKADGNSKFYTDEDFATWQRIIRLDAVRANSEWTIYSPSQAAVSEMKAQRSAQIVGLKDYDHLEPSRIYHAARLCKDNHLYRHLEQLQAEDCFFVYRMVVVLFRRELTFEQTLCLWEVIWTDQAAIRAGIAKSAWGRMRLRAPPTDDLLLYAIAACVLQRRKLIIEKYSSMDEIMRECNSMAGHLDVWKLLDDAHDLVVTLHDKI
ncbi:hypothetical protein CUMW_236170 [Citrus unshiu]|uniref:Rab-GAP TBC domain-containing protein n=1 Tax=Citrus unshiu TaxID=55188 RepID=A0A2H5QJI0_CITUN|nr:hypothetical protein CUMW_236170 [Citrus unshiu]